MEIDQLSLERAETLAPWLRKQVKDILNYLIQRGVKIRITRAWCSYEDQKKLYEAYLKGGALASPPGYSYHEYGLALDFVLMRGDKEVLWDLKADLDKDGKADWLEAVTAFEVWGWEAGYRWKGKKCDPPHVQKPFIVSGKKIKRISTGNLLAMKRKGLLEDGKYPKVS